MAADGQGSAGAAVRAALQVRWLLVGSVAVDGRAGPGEDLTWIASKLKLPVIGKG
jgi:hypothetical protein